MSRVVVTGLGLITSLGNDLASSWEALCQGKSGVSEITSFDTSQYRVHFAAQVKDFDPTLYMDRKEARRNDPYEQLAIASSKQALAHAGLQITAENGDDIGVYIGSGIGGLVTLHDQFEVLHFKGPDRISPFFINMMIVDGAPGIVSILTGAKGPNFAIVSACATSANTIGEAWETIRRGDARAMIAGGAEKCITPIAMASFDNMHAISRRNDDPQGASRPFDATRNGFVMGEGAGILILEDLDFAKDRGAKILAELVGYASTGDAYHITEPAPEGAGLVRAMRRALQKAGMRPDQVDYSHQGLFRRPCLSPCHQLHQVDDWAYTGCSGGRRGCCLCHGYPDGYYTADNQPASPRPRLRSRLRAQRSAAGCRQHCYDKLDGLRRP